MGDDLFAGMKKVKKTKKKVDFDDLEIPAAKPAAVETPKAAEPVEEAAPAVSEVDTLDFSDLKKKKKNKTAISLETLDTPEAPESTDAATADAASAPVESTDASNVLDDFSDLKKKKKKSGKKTAFDLDAFEKELAAVESSEAAKDGAASDDDVPTGGDLEDVPEGENPFEKEEGAGDEGKSKCELAYEKKGWIKEHRDYIYPELLGRFYSLLYASHPALSGAAKKRYTIPPPSMMRDGNKRSIFANVTDICKKMHRSPEHVIQFLFAELGTTGSVDGSGRLVIKGRFQQKHIENVLRKYILEYVTCKTCKSPDTVLEKDNRIYFVTCNSCQSRRSVQSITSGFKAITGKRKAIAA